MSDVAPFALLIALSPVVAFALYLIFTGQFPFDTGKD